jgi:hypothetical protein
LSQLPTVLFVELLQLIGLKRVRLETVVFRIAGPSDRGVKSRILVIRREPQFFELEVKPSSEILELRFVRVSLSADRYL